LALKLANTSIPILKILGKLLNLLIPCVCHHVVGLSEVSGLCKPLTHKSLEMVKCIHAPHRSQDGLLSMKVHQVVHMLHPVKPHRIVILDSREQANGGQGDLYKVLLTKGIERPHGSSLPSVSKAPTHSLHLQGGTPQVCWGWKESHVHLAPSNSHLHELSFHGTRNVPQNGGKTLPVEALRVHASVLIHDHDNGVSHLNKRSNG
jgi:hypothetical protein